MNYQVAHLSYSSAISELIKGAEKSKMFLTEDTIFDQISTRSRPRNGETARFSLPVLNEKGNPMKKYLHAQIYCEGERYELNMYAL